jgi:hypothetical protein
VGNLTVFCHIARTEERERDERSIVQIRKVNLNTARCFCPRLASQKQKQNLIFDIQIVKFEFVCRDMLLSLQKRHMVPDASVRASERAQTVRARSTSTAGLICRIIKNEQNVNKTAKRGQRAVVV